MQYAWAFSENSNISLDSVLNIPLSFSVQYYQSMAFENYKAKLKNQREFEDLKFKQGNSIIEALSNLAKMRR